MSDKKEPSESSIDDQLPSTEYLLISAEEELDKRRRKRMEAIVKLKRKKSAVTRDIDNIFAIVAKDEVKLRKITDMVDQLQSEATSSDREIKEKILRLRKKESELQKRIDNYRRDIKNLQDELKTIEKHIKYWSEKKRT